MITRKDYLNNRPEGVDRAAWHRAYYAQFVTENLKKTLARSDVFARIKDKEAVSPDPHLNQLGNGPWDKGVWMVPASAHTLMRELGDYMTLSGQVCILKEAARQLLEQGQ